MSNNDAEEDELEEEEDDDDENVGNDEDEEEDVEDACPIGCEYTLYDKVLALRETRLDYDDALSELNKQIDEGKKLADRLKQKDKQLTKEVTQADLEMVQFQRVKQAALNEINVTIPLKLSQIYTFEGSGALTNPREYTASHSPETSQHDHIYSQSVVSVPAFAPLMATPVPDEAALEEINVLQSADERVLSSQLTMQSHIVIDIRYVAHHLYTTCNINNHSFFIQHIGGSR